LSSKNNLKRVANNSFYLFLIQGVNYVFPLLLLVYLIKVLGKDGFGIYSFLLTLVIYIQTILDYGFLLTGSRDVAKNITNKNKLNEIFWSITFAKIFISIIVFILLSFFSLFFYKKIDYYLFVYLFLLAFFNSITPVWFLHGIEKFKLVAVFNAISKAAAFLLIVLTVFDASDIDKIFLSNIIPSFFVSLVVFIYLYRSNVVDRMQIDFSLIVFQVRSGWHIFTTSFLSSVLSSGSVFWLGLVSSPTVVGSYAIVESVVKVVSSLFQPLTRALYPVAVNEFSLGPTDGFKCVFYFGRWIALMALIAAIFVALLTPFAVFKLNGEEVAYSLVYLLSIWMFFGVLNNILGVQVLTAIGEVKKYSYAFYVSAAVFVSLLVSLVYFYNEKGAAVALLFSEFVLSIILSCLVFRVYKKSIS